MVLPELIAHRGYTLHYPENTLIAVKAAIDAGARYVEIDVQMSAEGVPVLFHDADLTRVCGTSGAVADYSLAQLKQFRAAERQRFGDRYAQIPIATLREFVALLLQPPHVTAFVELKVEALARLDAARVLERLRGECAPIAERAVLISYALEALMSARRSGWDRLGVVLNAWHERDLPIVRQIAPEFVFADVDTLPPTGSLDVAPARLAVFEVADAKRALTLARRGVALIETFALGELKRDLETRAAD